MPWHLITLLFLALSVWRLVRYRKRRPPYRNGPHRPSRRQWYRTEYLKSEHWRTFRNQWWQHHPHAVCTMCHGPRHPMDLHHLTYRRLGHEKETDVTPVHRSCHVAIHGH
jgi:hypothetical protein